ncbi:MAG: hypothetical protein BRC44_09740 [Cyanobacteria bacterium QS_4_48_99]|nr:MAG: hypothetical protein BRC44_09740 [Cyanobacteria bacterium QS_4_48_99]
MDIRARIEYSSNVTEQLKGTLDYYLSSSHNLLIVEVKREDLDNGFTQLAVELIAVQQWLETEEPLFGAIATGTIWQFGIFDPLKQEVNQDLNLDRVPADLHELLAIFFSEYFGIRAILFLQTGSLELLSLHCFKQSAKIPFAKAFSL